MAAARAARARIATDAEEQGAARCKFAQGEDKPSHRQNQQPNAVDEPVGERTKRKPRSVPNARKQESSTHNIAARNARQAQIGCEPTEMGAQHRAEAGSAIGEELPFRGRNDMADPEDGEACEPEAGIDAPGRGKDVTERQERENQSKDNAGQGGAHDPPAKLRGICPVR